MKTRGGAAGSFGVLLTRLRKVKFPLLKRLVKPAVALKRHLICYVGTVSTDQICLAANHLWQARSANFLILPRSPSEAAWRQKGLIMALRSISLFMGSFLHICVDFFLVCRQICWWICWTHEYSSGMTLLEKSQNNLNKKKLLVGWLQFGNHIEI